jgi:hypothetical protein
MWDIIFLRKLMIQLGRLATGFMIIPIFFALRRWKYLNKPLKVLFWYCIAKMSVNLLFSARVGEI